jgi:hypothetical protein
MNAGQALSPQNISLPKLDTLRSPRVNFIAATPQINQSMDRTLEKDSSSLFLLTQLHTDHQERAEREKAK